MKTTGDSTYQYVSVESARSPKMVDELKDVIWRGGEREVKIKVLNEAIKEYESIISNSK